MRIEGIDLLRGLAVSVVVLYHFFEILKLHNHFLYPYITSIGQIGVPLFFIISGYLIYRSIEYSIAKKGKNSGIKYFFLHRIFRIIPAYYVNFLVVFLLAYFIFGTMQTWSTDFTVKQILSHLTFTSYFFYQTSGLGINGAYWTLSIEMLWYFVAPLLFLFIKKDRYYLVIIGIALLYLWSIDLGLFDKFFHLDKTQPNYMAKLFFFSFQLPGQIIYFMSGIFIYKYLSSKYNDPVPTTLKWILFLLIMGIFIFLSHQPFYTSSFLVRNLITLVIVTALFVLLYQSHIRQLFFVDWVGKISYSIYLWHMPILYLFALYILPYHYSLASVAILFVVILLFISTLSYYYIEEGGFRLRQRLEKKLN